MGKYLKKYQLTYIQELKVIMKQFGFDVNDDLVKNMIKKIDLDGNGFIELQQFLNFIEKQISYYVARQVKKVIRDRNY